MGMDVYFSSALDIEGLKADTDVKVENTGDSYQISLKSEEGSAIWTYGQTDVDYCRVCQDSVGILRHIAEKYGLLIGADGFLNDAGCKAIYESRDMDIEEARFVFATYATEEMLDYAEAYGWSEGFVDRLKAIRTESQGKQR